MKELKDFFNKCNSSLRESGETDNKERSYDSLKPESENVSYPSDRKNDKKKVRK